MLPSVCSCSCQSFSTFKHGKPNGTERNETHTKRKHGTLKYKYIYHALPIDAAEDDLLRWVRSKIPEYNIQNFTKGRTYCMRSHPPRQHMPP